MGVDCQLPPPSGRAGRVGASVPLHWLFQQPHCHSARQEQQLLLKLNTALQIQAALCRHYARRCQAARAYLGAHGFPLLNTLPALFNVSTCDVCMDHPPVWGCMTWGVLLAVEGGGPNVCP